jgi:hypothetical protein
MSGANAPRRAYSASKRSRAICFNRAVWSPPPGPGVEARASGSDASLTPRRSPARCPDATTSNPS